MTYPLAVFFVLWALTFGYVFSLSSRQKQLESELESLRGLLDGESAPIACDLS